MSKLKIEDLNLMIIYMIISVFGQQSMYMRDFYQIKIGCYFCIYYMFCLLFLLIYLIYLRLLCDCNYHHKEHFFS